VPERWKQTTARRAAGAIATLVIALACLLSWSYHQRASERVRVAVLPFQAGPGASTLAATITQLVAHRLARLPRFTVLPTALTLSYAASHDSAHAIGRALDVRYLVVGEVDQTPTAGAADRITIDARLIDTGDSPPTMGDVISTLSSDLCPAIAIIAIDIAGHFARAPRGELWGPTGTTGCTAPRLLEQRSDPGN
jgi:TolB-like protein